jgi:hypothetical protein
MVLPMRMKDVELREINPAHSLRETPKPKPPSRVELPMLVKGSVGLRCRTEHHDPIAALR